MELTRCYKYRLSPTPEQESLFVQFAGCRRFVWNWALARKKATYAATGKSIGFNALCAELVAMKKRPETAFLKECCHSQVLQQTMRDLEKAYTAFFEKRSRFPKFKKRHKCRHAFRFPQCASIDGQGVSLPKIGRVRAIIHRAAEGEIKSATIKQEAGGAWYIVFVSHVELPDVPPTCENPVGIDMGLESFVTLTTGEKVMPPKFYRGSQRKLARLSRQHSRCKKWSKRRAKAKERKARFEARAKNCRADFLHKLSCRLVREHDTICIEDLNLKGLTKTKLAKSFHDAGIGAFLRMLEYKAEWNAGQVVKVGRFFPSSKTCHGCGARAKLTLSDREWTCSGCGVHHDRDGNAAANILREGLSLLSSRLAASDSNFGEVAGGMPETENAL